MPQSDYPVLGVEISLLITTRHWDWPQQDKNKYICNIWTNKLNRHFKMHVSIKIYMVFTIHHWRILWSNYRKLAWVGFEPITVEFCSDALTDWAIRPWVQLALRANFVQLLQFHCNWHLRFSECAYFWPSSSNSNQKYCFFNVL